MYVCVRVCAYACVRLNGSESEIGYSLSVQLECPLPAVCCWVKTVIKPLPLCSDTLWAVVSQHPTGASPSEQGATGVTGVLENGFYYVPTANCVQGVHGGELCSYDSLCSFD